MTVATDFYKTLIGGLPHLGTFAYANLPAAASWSGYTAFASDVGLSPGMLLVSNATRWIPCGPQVLARSATAVNAPADTSEDTLATIAVPAGLMGISGSLRTYARFSFTGSTNNKTFRVRYGGTQFHGSGTVTASLASWLLLVQVQNRDLANSQIGDNDSPNLGQGTLKYTGAVDSTAAQNLTITAQKATGSETMTLESYLVEVLP